MNSIMNSIAIKTGLVVLATTLCIATAQADVTNRPASPHVQPASPTNSWFGGWRNETPGIDRRQAEQEARISWGARNGSLTRHESQQLRAEQARIADMERRAKADGMVTREERMQIRMAQQQADRHIYQESTDNERRGSGRGWGWGRWGW